MQVRTRSTMMAAIARPTMLTYRSVFWSVQSVQFFLLFIGHHQSANLVRLRYLLSRLRNHWSPSIGKPRKTPVSIVKTTQSLVTINRQNPYDSDILHQDFGIIWVTIWVIHLPERIETGGPKDRIGSDNADRA